MTVTQLRMTKAEQGEATRARILTAAVECLIDYGYGQTTTLMVQERAGVSRGALLHHFGTRSQLLAEAVKHMFELQIAERDKMQIQQGGRIEQAVRLLWAITTSTMSIVGHELRTAARTDPELRSILVRHDAFVTTEIDQTCVYLFGDRLASHPNFPMTIRLLLLSMRGAIPDRVIQPTSSARADLAIWTEVAKRLLADGDGSDS